MKLLRPELETNVSNSGARAKYQQPHNWGKASQRHLLTSTSCLANAENVATSMRKAFRSLTFVLIAHLAPLTIASSQSTGKNLPSTSRVTKAIGEVWVSDNGNGTFTNPVLYADYSDPDVIRVGDDFYMTSSSFSHFPGLPILHSKDLVNWSIIGHAIQRYPLNSFNAPQHGNGVWAPSIQYHNGEYYIYFGDPDNGVFMTKTDNPAGPWDPIVLVREAKGWIDPCPLWDDDGQVYLVHAWANSRSGIKSILTLNKMNIEGTKVLDEGVTVFDGRVGQPTIEGPKIYKRNGYYYIFAPAGGVKPGWQTVLRSKAIYGPYEPRIVLEQGMTRVNGPHQGAWVETQAGESWFVHFQDRDAYGRIVHLEPMRWVDGWPMMGEDIDKNGIGEPVIRFRKPNVGGTFPVEVPQSSDEFSNSGLGLQWQWEANPDSAWFSLDARKGWLRLYSQAPVVHQDNMWNAGNILGQKIPGPEFSVTTKLDCEPLSKGEEGGLIVIGLDYSYIAIRRNENSFRVVQNICSDADKGNSEPEISGVDVPQGSIYLRLELRREALCRFSFSADGKQFHQLGIQFKAKPGKWVGSRIGLFAARRNEAGPKGFADVDWIRFKRLR